MQMHDCPKFKSCNAPICPLDPNWRKSKHLNGERVCLYLTEVVKTNAEANFRCVGQGELFFVIASIGLHIANEVGVINRAMDRASLSSSKLALGKRLKGTRDGTGN